MVLDAVNEMHRHVTADQIYTFVKEKYPSIGRVTVYRNLGIHVKEGKVRKVEVPDGSDRFDFTLENHYHVECVKCRLRARWPRHRGSTARHHGRFQGPVPACT